MTNRPAHAASHAFFLSLRKHSCIDGNLFNATVIQKTPRAKIGKEPQSKKYLSSRDLWVAIILRIAMVGFMAPMVGRSALPL
jgi:hypothetical protein